MLYHARAPVLGACGWGPLPTGCGRGGVWAWGPVTNPIARALACWICALWGQEEGARAGRLLPGLGASGLGRSPAPHRPSLVHAAGVRYPMTVGAGSVGVWTHHKLHSGRSYQLALRAVGAARGRLGGAPLF